MATIVTLNPSRAVDLNGFAIPGARATFYNSGTTTPRTVYSDPDCQFPHTQPVVADGAGVFPPIYDDSQSDLRVSVTDASGAMLPGYPIDPAVKTSTSLTGASAVQFNPTPEIPVQTVQAAIERVQANIVDPIADFGLGVTGNATLLADIDDKAVASGFYRYDNTTLGTFPANLTPPTDGMVLIFRQNASNVLQLVLSTRRIFRRRLQANSWTAWSWLVDSLDVADNATWAAGTQNVPYVISPAALKAAADGFSDRAPTDVAGARIVGTTYQNTTGRTIYVAIDVASSGAQPWREISADGVTWTAFSKVEGYTWFAVPPGYRYRVKSNATIRCWVEWI